MNESSVLTTRCMSILLDPYEFGIPFCKSGTLVLLRDPRAPKHPLKPLTIGIIIYLISIYIELQSVIHSHSIKTRHQIIMDFNMIGLKNNPFENAV